MLKKKIWQLENDLKKKEVPNHIKNLAYHSNMFLIVLISAIMLELNSMIILKKIGVWLQEEHIYIYK